MILVEIETDAGITGIGESLAAPDGDAVARLIQSLARHYVGASPFAIARLSAMSRQSHFAAIGTGSTPRFANQVQVGLELALWDLVGKAVDQPVHALLGGAVRDFIQYFGFLQGDTTEELVADTKRHLAAESPVIYLKVGRGERKDLENVAAVRAAAPRQRLRLDANEAWDRLTAIRMLRELSPYAPEIVEQPTASEGIEALAALRHAVDIPLAADQCVYTPADVQEVCRQRAADLIVLGLHEAGGVIPFRKSAAIAEASGINICIHGVFETGITTCASNQVGATITNLDDANQVMFQLLEEDIIESPKLGLLDGRMSIVDGPGFGFTLNADAVARAAENYRAVGQKGESWSGKDPIPQYSQTSRRITL